MKHFCTRILIVITLFSACSKDPGPGGKASIRGTVITKVYDEDFRVFQSQHPSTEVNVYIVYGNETTFGDNVKTDYKGNYEFRYLQPGDYTIYTFSDDSTLSNPSGELQVATTVTIPKGASTIQADTLYRAKAMDLDDGFATITGKAFYINYTKNFGALVDTSKAQDAYIYIAYENDISPDDRVKTNFDGSYSFKHLLKGTYTIYGYSENKTGGTSMLIEKRKVVITEDFQKVIVSPDIYMVREL